MKKIRAYRILGLYLAVVLYLAPSLFAVAARPGLRVVKQPDGSKFRAEKKGDEWFNWTETENKLPVIHNAKSGFYEYAQVRRGALAATGQIVGKKIPSGIRATPHAEFQTMAQQERTSRAQIGAASLEQSYSRALQAAPQRAAMTGTQKVLVLLVNFSNRALTYSEDEWAQKFFGETNSVHHYYKEISYNQLNMQPAEESSGTNNNGIVTVTLNYNHPNTADDIDERNQQIVKDAVLAADPYMNFAAFDSDNDGNLSETELHVVVIPAGYEAAYSYDTPSVWAHKWTIFAVSPPMVDGKEVAGWPAGGYTMFGETQGDHSATIGVIVHEMGHDLGLPDLYDGWSSNSGVVEWDVMANGSWSGGNLAGDTPTHMSAWSKYFLGWVTPYKVSHSSVSAPIAQSETGNGNDSRIKQLLSNPNGAEMSGTGEYFLVENRQKVGYDKYLPGSGILIWHIDETRNSNVSTNNKLVKLMAADDQLYWSNDGDTYPGSTGNRTFNNTSSPNSNLYNGDNSHIGVSNISNGSETMTADFAPPQPKLSLSTSSLTFSEKTDSKTFKISNTGEDDSTLFWKITSDKSWITVSSLEGSLAKGSETQITVSLKSSELATGAYSGSITVNDAYTLSLEETVLVGLATKDITPPGKPLAVVSKTHPNPSKVYPESKPEFTLTGPEDASGISGYFWKIDQTSDTVPTSNDNFSNKTAIVITSSIEDGTWVFHAIAKDGAGNVGSLAYHQPFIVKTSIDVSQENTFETGDGVTVAIPPGTLSSSTQISIEKKTTAPTQTDTSIKETRIYREIKLADGTRTFNKEVTVTLPYTASDVVGLNEKELRLFYYDESESQWKLIENSSVDIVNKKVNGKVNHFTLFSAMQYAESISNTILIYPNPYRPDLSSHLANGILITGTPAYSDLKIFTVSGELVKQLRDDDGNGTIRWDAKNENGDPVSSGIYFAHLHDAGKTKLLKLAIQR